MRKIAIALLLLCLFPVSSYAVNYALDFDGTNDILEVPDSDDWAFGSGDFTITAWTKWNSLEHYAFVLHQGTFNNINTWYVEPHISAVQGGSITFNVYGSGFFSKSESGTCSMYATDTWYNIAIVRRGNNVSVYNNGVECGSPTSYSGTIGNFGGPLMIGANYPTPGIGEKYFDGLLDEIGIWNYGMTEEELQLWMGQSPTGPVDGLLAYWDFNEGSGNIVYDKSGRGHHGRFGAYYNSYSDNNHPQWVGSDSPVSPVPEPSTLLMIGVGLFGAGVFRRRKQ